MARQPNLQVLKIISKQSKIFTKSVNNNQNSTNQLLKAKKEVKTKKRKDKSILFQHNYKQSLYFQKLSIFEQKK